jgi:four helix bundle protein
VCANLAGAWNKRRYVQAFIAKLSDAEGEAAETQVWIELAVRCGYLSSANAQALDDKYDHIGVSSSS